MSKLGLSVGPSAVAKKKIELQEAQKKCVDDLMGKEDQMTERQAVQVIGDNIDITRTPSRMTKERQRKSWHWFLLVGVKNRVVFPDLEDDGAQADITSVDNSAFIPSVEDCNTLDENLTLHIMKVLVKYIPYFRNFQRYIPDRIEHRFMQETSQRSEYVVLDMLDKSENKHDDMISILEYVHQQYIPHTQGDNPMVLKKKVFGGDVLTNERAYSAQLAMLNSPTDFSGLKGVVHRPEGLHRMMNFLLMMYQKFYKAASAQDPGTLYQLRNVLSRLDVKGPDEVTGSYRAHLSFVEDTLDAYIIGACLHMLGMDNLESDPTASRPPLLSDEDNYSYVHDIARNLLDKYVKATEVVEGLGHRTSEMALQNSQIEDMYDAVRKKYVCNKKDCQKKYKTAVWLTKHLVKDHEMELITDAGDNKTDVDFVAVYRSSFMKCGLLLRDTKDAFQLSDVDRILRNTKFEFLCADVAKHTKYRLWLFRFVAYCVSLLSPKQAMEYIWNCTANTSGGINKNIPNDNLVEILVQSVKKKVRQQGANATYQSARKAALAIQVQDAIRDNISKQAGAKPAGKTRAAVDKSNDVKLILAELAKSNI